MSDDRDPNEPAGGAEPQSHDTAGQFPADEVTEGAERGGNEPESHETAGQFPADEVAATHGDTAPASEPAPEPPPSE
jgi:hypothetical protein